MSKMTVMTVRGRCPRGVWPYDEPIRLAASSVVPPPGLTAGGGTHTPSVELLTAEGSGVQYDSLSWVSLDTGVATVNASTGEVTPVTGGTARIRALATKARASGQVMKFQYQFVYTIASGAPVVTSLEANPAAASVAVGQNVVVSLTPRDAQGIPITGQTITVLIADGTKVSQLGGTDYALDPTIRVTLRGVAETVSDVNVTFEVDGTAVTAVVPVTVTPAPAVQPFYTMDFPYADTAALFATGTNLWQAGVRHGWYPAEDVNPQLIFLDDTKGGPSSATGKSMRYFLIDRTSEGPPTIPPPPKGYCGDKTIGRAMRYKDNMVEVWSEAFIEYSANFTTLVPGGACTGVSSAGHKTWFFNVLSPNTGRFGITVHPGHGYLEWPTSYSPSGNHNGDHNNNINGAGPDQHLAGVGWVRLRCHFRNSRSYALPAIGNRIESGTFRAGSTTNVFQLQAGGGVGVTPGTYITITKASGIVTGARLNVVSGAGGATPSVTLQSPSLTAVHTPAAGDTYIIATEPVQGDGYVGVEWATPAGVIYGSRYIRTNLVTAPGDTTARAYLTTASSQVIRGFQLCRNMNQGPIGKDIEMWWSDIKSWDADPGWGW